MTVTVAPGTDVELALAGAYGAATRAGRVGTEHILLSLAGRDCGAAGEVLDEFDVTPTAVLAVLRNASGVWHSDDAAPVDADPLGAVEWYGRKPMNYTGAARAALRLAMTGAAERQRTAFDTEDLLRALLAGTSRAVELLDTCGVDRDRLRRRLDGAPPEGPTLEPDLWPTRDVLLGRVRYRVTGPSARLTGWILRMVNANRAAMPVQWIGPETGEQARRLGQPPGTAHVLLAVLATHEVARAYPHLVGDAEPLYAGAKVLAGLGVTYRAARAAAASMGNPREPGRVSAYLRRGHDTAEIVLAILDGDTRAARLLDALGVPPADVRRRLRAGQ